MAEPIQNLLSGDETALRDWRPFFDRVLTENALSTFDRERVQQLREIQRNDIYYRGDQNTYPFLFGSGRVDYLPLREFPNQLSPSTDFDDEDFLNDHVTNIYRGDTRKFVSVLGQRPPNVNAEPRIKDSDEQIRRARKAQKIAQLFFDAWDLTLFQQRFALFLAKNGTTFLHTPWIVDGYHYGRTSEPTMSEQEIRVGPATFACPECAALGETDSEDLTHCPECGSPLPLGSVTAPPTAVAPVPGPPRTYQNGNVEIVIESGLSVATPYWIQNLRQTPWLRYEYEADKAKLLSRHPQLHEYRQGEPSGGVAESDYGRWVREEIRSFTSTDYYSYPDRWLYTRWWWKPYMFEYIHEADRREALKEAFPDGVKLTAVNGLIIAVSGRRLESEWVMAAPEPFETAYPGGWMNDSIQFQEQSDTMLEIAIEHAERQIMTHVADPSVINPEKIRQIGRRAAEFIFSEPNSSGQLRGAIQPLDLSTPRPEHVALMQALQGINREITGMLPSIFGGGPSHATLGEAEIDRNQALMVLTLPWNNIRVAWGKTMRNAVMQFARYSGGKFHLPLGEGEHSHETVDVGDVSDLLLGGWKFDAEEGMPMTAGQMRAYLMSILQTGNPELWNALGIFHPANVQRVEDMLGMAGLHSPQRQQREALLDIIRQLIQTEPLPGPMGPEPAVLPDPFLFEPSFAAETIRLWLTSEEGQRLQETMPQAWQHVLLYGRMYYEMTLPPPEPAEGEGDGEGEGGGGQGAPGPGPLASEAAPIEGRPEIPPGVESPEQPPEMPAEGMVQ